MHFLKRVGLEFFQEFFTKEEEFISLIFPRTSFTLWRLYWKKFGIWILFSSMVYPIMKWSVMRPWKLSLLLLFF